MSPCTQIPVSERVSTTTSDVAFNQAIAEDDDSISLEADAVSAASEAHFRQTTSGHADQVFHMPMRSPGLLGMTGMNGMNGTSGMMQTHPNMNGMPGMNGMAAAAAAAAANGMNGFILMSPVPMHNAMQNGMVPTMGSFAPAPAPRMSARTGQYDDFSGGNFSALDLQYFSSTR